MLECKVSVLVNPLPDESFSLVEKKSICRRQLIVAKMINLLPNDKILDWSKLNLFADNKINVTKKLKFELLKGRKQCVQRRKCLLPALFLLPIMFSKGFFPRVVKSLDCVIRVKFVFDGTPFPTMF